MKNIITILLLVVAGIIVYNFLLKPPSFDPGDEAPTFEGTLIDGTTFKLEDMRGKYVLLDFWGSWCGPCRKEIPMLKSLYKDFNGTTFKDADGFEIVSIALEKSDVYTKKIIEDQQLIWPSHIIDVNSIIMLSKYAQLYEVKDLPTKFLINPEGKFMGTNLPEAEIRRLMKERQSL